MPPLASKKVTAMNPHLVELRDLKVAFDGVQVLHGIDLTVGPGEALGLVGESGCGKSVTWLAALGLLPGKASVSGSVKVDGREIGGGPRHVLESVRGGRIAMIFQDPSSSLNPVLRIGRQVFLEGFLVAAETLLLAILLVAGHHVLRHDGRLVRARLFHLHVEDAAQAARDGVRRRHFRAIRAGHLQRVQAQRLVVDLEQAIGDGRVHRHPGVLAFHHRARWHHPAAVGVGVHGQAGQGQGDQRFIELLEHDVRLMV